MKFLSTKEFFYKLNTIGFILLLAPLGAFIFLYLTSVSREPVFSDPLIINWVAVAVAAIFATDLTIVHWYLKMRLQTCRKRAELASRLDGWFPIQVVRMATYCGGGLLAAVGYYLTGSLWFTLIFFVIELAGILQWPTQATFCKEFELQGMEREMVMYGRDVR